MAQQTGFRARGNAAQANSFEAFPLFAAGVIIATLAQVDAARIDLYAMVFVAARVGFIVCYVADKASLRSLCYRGSSNHWLAPVLGAALVGSVIYAASTPSYAIPQTVVVQQQYAPPTRVAYFCPTAQQFYPNVPTCQVPWQVTSY